MPDVIVAIGGSGQMVLHHYVQQYLIGAVRKPFRAFVLDTDRCSDSLDRMGSYFEDLARAMGPSQTRGQVPSIRYVPLRPDTGGNTVADLLMQQPVPSQPGFHHPAQAFFSLDSLRQQVSEGLYARPALAAVVALERALETVQPEQFTEGTRVVLVSSCIGGTGGGLAIPVLWRLATSRGASLSLHAVLMGEYFHSAGQQQKLQEQTARFRSNRLLFLRALQEVVPSLRAYSFIEEPRMAGRDPQAEQAARNMAWSEQDSPYWQSACALDYLLRETVQDIKDFEQREVRASSYGGSLQRAECWQRLCRGVGIVDALCRYQVLQRLTQEAFVERVWGAGLVRFLAGYWERARMAGGSGGLAPAQFVHRVARETAELWRNPGKSYDLSLLFPACSPELTSVREIRELMWPAPPDNLERSAFADADTAARMVASVVLFTALRQGGR